jgi:hypothetical protein
MLKTTGCGLFGGDIISGRIIIYDVAVHGKKISNNWAAETLTRVATGT